MERKEGMQAPGHVGLQGFSPRSGAAESPGAELNRSILGTSAKPSQMLPQPLPPGLASQVVSVREWGVGGHRHGGGTAFPPGTSSPPAELCFPTRNSSSSP